MKTASGSPISLADINPAEGTISIIVMAVGKTTTELSHLKAGEDILDLCGPLGNPTHIESAGKVIVVGGGFGVAPLYPIARSFKAAGSEVVCIMGARSKDLLIYEKEMGDVCSRVVVTTDDGSKGMKGFVTQALANELETGGADLVVTVGPAVMMKTVANTTRPFGVKTVVSLNPDHGRRNRHVRRVPGHGGRTYAVRLHRRPRVRWAPGGLGYSHDTAEDLYPGAEGILRGMEAAAPGRALRMKRHDCNH